MKGNNKHQGLYRELTLDQLPANAMPVQDYADLKGYRSTSTIYNIVRAVRDKKKTWESAGFEVVIFKGFNYILPLT